MVYPQFKGKHLQESLIHPNKWMEYMRIKEKYKGKLPKKYIFFYDKNLLKHIKRKYKPKSVYIYSSLTILIYKDIGFIHIPGYGCPVAASILEELISMGGKIFLNLGIAGGLNCRGIFLCKKALIDEGTSFHYVSQRKYSYPDASLTKKFGSFLKKNKLDYKEGTTWTIDAPYRETKAEIKRYIKQGIKTVEMECSALFTVAKYRKVKLASAFVVSDVLGKKWEPEFHKFNIKDNLKKLFDLGVKCINTY